MLRAFFLVPGKRAEVFEVAPRKTTNTGSDYETHFDGASKVMPEKSEPGREQEVRGGNNELTETIA